MYTVVLKYPVLLKDLNWTRIFSGHFSKNTQVWNFIKIYPEAAESFHADWRTDISRLTDTILRTRLKNAYCKRFVLRRSGFHWRNVFIVIYLLSLSAAPTDHSPCKPSNFTWPIISLPPSSEPLPASSLN